MANTKRYYWLKLKEDFLEEDTFEWIGSQENGQDYLFFYLKLCIKALRKEGILIRAVGERLIPYDVKSLAKLTNTDFDTVAMALKLFEKIKLISVLDTGAICLNLFNEMVGSETQKAIEMRKKREITKSKEQKGTMFQNVPKCSTEKEIEKDTELEIEKDLDKELRLSLSTKIDELKTKWNKFVSDNPDYQLAKCKVMSDKLKAAIKARLNEKEYDYDEILSWIPKQPFLLGNNDRNWKVNFNFTIGTKWANIITENFYPKPKLSRHEQKRIEDKMLREKNDRVLKEMLKKC